MFILQRGCQSIEDSIENDNPWDLSDPKAYYNKYRAKADEYLKERDEMYRKANEAFKRQQRSVAAYYAKLVGFVTLKLVEHHEIESPKLYLIFSLLLGGAEWEEIPQCSCDGCSIASCCPS